MRKIRINQTNKKSLFVKPFSISIFDIEEPIFGGPQIHTLERPSTSTYFIILLLK